MKVKKELVILSISMEQKFKEALEKESERQDIPTTSLVRRLLRDGLEKLKTKKGK